MSNENIYFAKQNKINYQPYQVVWCIKLLMSVVPSLIFLWSYFSKSDFPLENNEMIKKLRNTIKKKKHFINNSFYVNEKNESVKHSLVKVRDPITNQVNISI